MKALVLAVTLFCGLLFPQSATRVVTDRDEHAAIMQTVTADWNIGSCSNTGNPFLVAQADFNQKDDSKDALVFRYLLIGPGEVIEARPNLSWNVDYITVDPDGVDGFNLSWSPRPGIEVKATIFSINNKMVGVSEAGSGYAFWFASRGGVDETAAFADRNQAFCNAMEKVSNEDAVTMLAKWADGTWKPTSTTTDRTTIGSTVASR